MRRFINLRRLRFSRSGFGTVSLDEGIMANTSIDSHGGGAGEEQKEVRHRVRIDRMVRDILRMEERELEVFYHLPTRSHSHRKEDDNKRSETFIKMNAVAPQVHRHMDLPQENIWQQYSCFYQHQIIPPFDTSVEVESVAEDERAEAVEDDEDGDERRDVEAPCVTQHAGDTDHKRHAGILHRTHEDEAAGSVVEEGEFHQVAHAQGDHQPESEVVEHLVLLMPIQAKKVFVFLCHMSVMIRQKLRWSWVVNNYQQLTKNSMIRISQILPI